MAPYVEMEWGSTAYELMWQLKELFDPNYVLNPGVILNAVRNLPADSLACAVTLHAACTCAQHTVQHKPYTPRAELATEDCSRLPSFQKPRKSLGEGARHKPCLG